MTRHADDGCTPPPRYRGFEIKMTGDIAPISRPSIAGLSRMDWLAVGLIFAIGAVYQFVNPVNPDISWLFVVDEKMLAGARLYADVIEANPPMSVFLYMPAVLLQHLIGVPAEILQILITLGIIVGSLALTCRTMAASGRAADIARFLTMAAFVLVVMPLYVFSEREHIAIALMLPSFGIIVARADGYTIDRATRVIAGIATGIAICIKPHFAVGLLVPAIYLAIRLRSVRTLFAQENILAAGVASAYAVVVLVFFRIYLTDILPMLVETYRLLKYAPLDLMTDTQFLITFGTGIAAVIIIGRDARAPRVLVPILAAIGFLFAYFEQGKGWIYHLFPSLALVFIVFLSEALPRLRERMNGTGRFTRRSALTALLSVAVLFGLVRIVSVLKGRNWATIEMAERIKQTFSHPKILALSWDLSIGHPLTRMVGGSWVGTFGCQFVTQTATYLYHVPGASEETKARLAGWIALDWNYLARDLREGRPDLMLVDREKFPWDALMASGTEAAALLGTYQRIATINDIDLMVPRDRVAETVAKGALGR